MVYFGGVRDAYLRDGSWPVPEQPAGRSLVGRLVNIVELERRGRFQAASVLRQQTLDWVRCQGEVPSELAGVEAALGGAEPLGPWLARFRGSDVRFDVV